MLTLQATTATRAGKGLAARVIKAREKAKLSQRALATRAGLGSSAVCRFENGSRLPTLDTITRLAKALDVRPEWLAFGTGPQKR